MGVEIAGITVCNLCGEKFAGPATIAIVSGVQNAAQGRTVAYLAKLQNHIATKHPKENRVIELRAVEFLGMLRMTNFRTSDESLAQQCDFLRWQIHQASIGARLPDENLAAACADLTDRLTDTLWAMLESTYDQERESTPEFVKVLKADFKAEILKTILPEFQGLRDVLQEFGKYTVSTIQPPGPGPASRNKPY